MTPGDSLRGKQVPVWLYEISRRLFGEVSEGVLPAHQTVSYPMCVEGARACPPEDCGGPWGYADYLAAVADPEHEQHEEMLEWRGSFDPEVFDPKKATKEMWSVP